AERRCARQIIDLGFEFVPLSQSHGQDGSSLCFRFVPVGALLFPNLLSSISSKYVTLLDYNNPFWLTVHIMTAAFDCYVSRKYKDNLSPCLWQRKRDSYSTEAGRFAFPHRKIYAAKLLHVLKRCYSKKSFRILTL